MKSRPTTDNAETRRCANCRFCLRERAATESLIPGLSSLGSAFGASIGESRLCRRHDRLVSPEDHCPEFR